MCTVSFVASDGNIILTSNRDEKIIRPQAVEPKIYIVNNKNIIFPKDPKAGGTWYAVTETANIAVLLNGAAEKHQLKSKYRKSRGLILLDIISGNSPIETWKNIDLQEIEPFTIVLFQENKLYQLRWNEVEKETVNLRIEDNYIWSSSTLYPKAIREKRTKWFYEFINSKTTISADNMIHFHRHTESENDENGLVINRNDTLKTLSITQTTIVENKIDMSYFDLIQAEKFENNFIII
ncbi:MAG: NRDE family protein [Flavobacterium sp.]|nr:NRDE family protein [Flavobacterium sp.]